MENIDNMEVNVEYNVSLSSLVDLGINIVNGWRNFFLGNVAIDLGLVKQFWKTITISQTEILEIVLGKEIYVSIPTIVAGIRCSQKGLLRTLDEKPK